MNMYDIIEKKRDGGILSDEEIRFFVNGYTDGSIPDYQAAAFLMAAYIRGLDKDEIYSLTKAMKFSGDVVDLSSIKGIKVDKHSTGGVGEQEDQEEPAFDAGQGPHALGHARRPGEGQGHDGHGTV